MNTNHLTAAEFLKTYASHGLANLNLGTFHNFTLDKKFNLDSIIQLSKNGVFGAMFNQLVLRVPNDGDELNSYMTALKYIPTVGHVKYRGTDSQNRRIDAAVSNSGISAGNQRYNEGAATSFVCGSLIPANISNTPIAIIGYGAAGIIISSALLNIGFRNITVFDKAQLNLGIWGQKNVYGLSRNNPARLQLFDRVLNPAPGSGEEVSDFLSSLAVIPKIPKNVVSVKSANHAHTLTFSDNTSAVYPIVVNAIGLGKPKQISDPARMMSETGIEHAGARWQTRLEPAQVKNKLIVLIGLGNSTAEMLRQIHDLQDKGVDVNYFILTHYPEDSVYNPNTYVSNEGRVYRVFRDLSIPTLVDFQGDLSVSRHDYFRALHNEKIIHGVKRWEVLSPGIMSVYDGSGAVITVIPFDKVMSLIGYRQPKEVMIALGCSYDNQNQCGHFDYDGELCTPNPIEGKDRKIKKGYFGFGSVLETPLNQNTVVIPGMLHRLGDTVFGICMRAQEYALQKR